VEKASEKTFPRAFCPAFFAHSSAALVTSLRVPSCPTNGNEDNTTSVTASTNSAGRTIRGRVTLDGFGSTTSSSPTDRINGQNIDTWELLASTDTLVVIDRLELTRNHFDNLKQLHGVGNFLWVISHDGGDISDMQVTSFLEGDETRPTPNGFDDPQNIQAEVDASNYYNAIFVQGAEDANGDRPTAEQKADQSVINNDGREISPGVLRDPKITTEAGAQFRANSLLETAQSNNDLIGTVTVPPTDLNDPGFAREVNLGDGGKEKTVEEVSLTEQPQNVQVRYRFGLPNELSEDISELKRKARDIGDKV